MQGTPAAWRRTPPALFAPVLGLFGLGLAWRQAATTFGVPAGLGEAILGMVTLLYLAGALSYAAKAARRPGAVLEDLRVLPGRAGLAGLSLSAVLLAGTMIPYAPDAAQVLLLAAMALHGLLAGLVVVVLLRGPAEQRVVTPVWHLTFVGFVLVPLVAAPLGWIALSQAIALVTGAAALAILGASALQLLRRRVPAPLRPLLAIHLAPVSVLGAVAVHLGQPLLAQALGWLALGLVAALLLRLRALLEAGFSPLWGAFTFPLAAFTNLMLLLAAAHPLWLVPGGLGLASATLAIPAIALRVVRLWADGTLALKTNAAVA